MQSVEFGPVAERDQRQRPLDLFFIFAGANVVATTLQIGASLPAMPLAAALGVIAAGSLGGAALVALLAPVGSRLRVPSIVACRAALGYRGAQLVAAILFLTNFVWIALNNAVAASIASRLAGDVTLVGAWAVGLGLLATFIVAGGPRAVGRADRLAVPMLCVAGAVYTVACLRAPLPAPVSAGTSLPDLLRAFDVVFGYQTSWLLMFGDYSRYSRSGRSAAWAVFAGLGLSALWFIPLGLVASSVAGSADPGAMVLAAGVGWWGGVLIVLAALTTNFVNIYMSALALRSLWPGVTGRRATWVIGGVGGAISLLSTTWLDQLANFTLLLAGVFVPIGGLLLAHFRIARHEDTPDTLYHGPGGEPPRVAAWSAAGVTAWLAGMLVFYLARPIGGVLPSLACAVAVYLAVKNARSSRPVSP